MNLDIAKNRIDAYLKSNKRLPVIVDLPTKKELAEFVDYFSIGNNSFFTSEQFCNADGVFKPEELINAIINNDGNTFIVAITAFLKLNGEQFAKTFLKTLLSKSINGHVVIITYQCRDFLKFSDSRFSERNQINIVDGEFDPSSNVYIVNPQLADSFPGSYMGFNKFGIAYEKEGLENIYILSNISKQSFESSIINICQMSDAYDIICEKDAITKNIPSTYGSPAQWTELLRIIENGNWTTVTEQYFGSIQDLDDCISDYLEFDDFKKWLYFSALSIFGIKKNAYFQQAIFSCSNYQDFVKSLFRTILSTNHYDNEFKMLYEKRKDILRNFTDSLEEIVDYCKVVSVKEDLAIYYLTDLTQPERERIIEWLNSYGMNYSTSELIEILRVVYPDLADYLSSYRFKNELLENYFDNYKYQKVINKLLPDFKSLVDEQSENNDYVSILPPRTFVIDKLNLSNKHTHVYFFDALGVEYLGYIQAKCNQYKLSANITCAHCELPSLTCFNKEFIETFKDKGCSVSDIKILDTIKHHGEESFDYEKNKTPIYLIKELEEIDNLLKQIRAHIYSGKYDKIIIVSDHGASRLAVLNETENLWRMATDGVHSGRCCPTNEIDCKPDAAIENEGFWVLSNYDRFKGSRKANVEVHGGATLEEVTVPIIEISKKPTSIEAFIVPQSKIIVLAAKEYPTLKLFVSVDSNNIAIRIGDKYYDATKTSEEYIYTVDLPEFTRKGKYNFDIILGDDTIASSLSFEVKKKGFSENSLFD